MGRRADVSDEFTALGARRRRAGEDDQAIQRAIDVTRRFATVRNAASLQAPASSFDEDLGRIVEALAAVVVEVFCDWCVVDVVGPPRRRLVQRRRATPRDGSDPPNEGRFELDDVIRRVVAEGRRQQYPSDVTRGLPTCLVAPLSVHDEVIATVGFGRDDATPGFGPMESTAADEIAWGAATTLERLDLRRRAEAATAAVRASEARWRVLVESAPIGLIEVDVDERVRWWNRAAAAIFVWPSPADAVGDPSIPVDVLTHLRSLWSDLESGDLPDSRELHGVDVAGRLRDLAISARRLLTGDGSPATLLTLVDDVTDRRQMREELRHARTMEIRGLVAGSAIHDFNNLLTIISGYGELLADELPDGSAREAATAIVATSARASALTGQLQTIGRTQRPDPVTLDPTSVVESNAEVIERILGGPVAFSWSAPDDPVYVHVDADQFEQVLLNLVINARDAMPDGGELHVDVRRAAGAQLDAAHRVDRAGDFVVVAVTDTGVGMSEEVRRRCFEPLFTTKGPFAGTGLGLAAARRLVEESRGSIECRSQLGVGSTFEVVLPVAEAAPDRADVVEVSSPLPRRAATILVVEDDEALRRLIVQILRRNGHRVVDADSGESALSVLDDAVELVVSDVVMGAVSGIDLARRIGEMSVPPAVLLTSATADASILDGLDLEAVDFIAKPFRPSQLVDRVHALLARRTAGSRQA